MYELIPAKESSQFKIIHRKISEEEVKFQKLKNIWDEKQYMEVYGLTPGTYVVLGNKKNGETIMSDTWMEQYTNHEIIEKANGNVLIAGLGIGLIILPIQAKECVKSIVIIEKYQEIIDLVLPHLPLNNKVKVICADIDTYEPKNNIKFDTIYFDIWNNITADNYPQMKDLHKKFRKFLNNKVNPNCFIESWRRSDCRRLDKENRKYDYNDVAKQFKITDEKIRRAILKNDLKLQRNKLILESEKYKEVQRNE